MADVEITIRNNGPYRVSGPIKLLDADGNPVDLGGRDVFALCRCGGSTNKPFCDGTHSKIGFQGAIAAVEKAEEK
jgi:CDGSH-type Zn-finger protein